MGVSNDACALTYEGLIFDVHQTFGSNTFFISSLAACIEWLEKKAHHVAATLECGRAVGVVTAVWSLCVPVGVFATAGVLCVRRRRGAYSARQSY